MNGTDPLVSIIVPCYNHAPFLAQRMESIFAQTYPCYEVILLDDASTDGSAELLASYARDPRVSHWVTNERNSGSAFRQWRRGVERARGEWVWIAESDDYCLPGFLESLVGLARAHPEALLFASGFTRVDEAGRPLPGGLDYPLRVVPGSEVVPAKFNWGTYIWNVSCALFRRDAFRFVDWERVCAMRFCGDWLLYGMVLRHGALATYPTKLARYRVHAATVSRSPEAVYLRYEEGIEVLRYLLAQYSFGFFALWRTAFMWHWALWHTTLPREAKSSFRDRLETCLGNKSAVAYWATALLFYLLRLRGVLSLRSGRGGVVFF